MGEDVDSVARASAVRSTIIFVVEVLKFVSFRIIKDLYITQRLVGVLSVVV